MKKIIVVYLALQIIVSGAGLTTGVIPVAIPSTGPGFTSSLSNGPMSVFSLTNIVMSGDFAPYSIHLNGSNLLSIITTYGGGIPSLAPFVPSGNDASLPGSFTAQNVISDVLFVNTISVTNTLSATNSTLTGGTFSGYTNSDLTASRVVLSDANKRLSSSPVTSAEVAFVGGVTSAIQTQLNAKQSFFTTGLGITNNGGVLSNNIVAGSGVTIVGGSNGQLTIASTGGGGSSNTTTFMLTSPVTVNNTTNFTDITSMGIVVAAGQKVHFRYRLYFSHTSATPGIKFTMNGPAIGAGSVIYGVLVQNSGTAATTITIPQTAYLGSFPTSISISSGTIHWAELEGTLINGATSGTLIPQFGQSVLDASNVTILAMSTLTYQYIP